jgi:hypothetical protein
VPRTYSADGKTIKYFLTVFNPPIPMRPDPARINQDSAINSSIFFLAKLQQGDIKTAAAACEYPDADLKMYEEYKARVGDAEFSKQIAKLFDDDRYLYELRIDNEHALISEKHPEGARILIEKHGKFYSETFEHESPQFKTLFVLVNAWSAGKLQLK